VNQGEHSGKRERARAQGRERARANKVRPNKYEI